MSMKIKTLLVPLLLLINSSNPEELCAEDVTMMLREYLQNVARANGIEIPGKVSGTSPPTPSDQEEYDFVIVGSGSSGSVLLNRLSRRLDWKILVVEAGDEPDYLTEIPMLAVLHQFTHHNWGYLTEKQPHFGLGFDNQRLHWPRGKGLGGSSLINYMIYSRGKRHDYDTWASLGNDGWSYDEVLPHFKRLEDSKLARQDGEYRGKGGDVTVEDVKYRTKSALVFVEAAQKLGYDYVDVNGASQIGVEYPQATTKNGFRCSAEKAFVRPVRTRENLTIRLNSHVTKILIEEATKTAYGIQYIHKGKTYTANANKEVILSAGSIGSPHLLMLSGIGPKENLEANGIHVIENLPIGQKLYDHLTYTGLLFTFDDPITYDLGKTVDPKSFLDLHRDGTGSLQVLAGFEAMIYAKTNATSAPDYPDVELAMLSLHVPSDKGVSLQRTLRITETIYDAVFKPYEDKPCWGIFPVLLHPKSFGHIRLQSPDPFIHPKIYANYFSDGGGDDLKTLVAAIREAIRIAKSTVGSKMADGQIPGCATHVPDSDEYWTCAVRHLATTAYHPTTTCKMGPSTDPEAVVDQRLLVRNVKGLRVVDASVIPTPITGHTNVPAFMIAEKAAAMILEDWS